MTISVEWMMTLAGFVLSLLSFSLILGDNGLYRFAGSVFSGLTSGILLLILVERIFYPCLILPLTDAETDAWLRIVSFISLGLILILIIFHFQRSRGAGLHPMLNILFFAMAAVTLAGTVSGTLIPLAEWVIRPFALSSNDASTTKWGWAEALITLVSVVTSLTYTRQLTIERENRRSVGRLILFLEQVGEIMVAVAFGAVFAGVFLSSAWILVNQLGVLLNGAEPLLEGFLR